MEENGKMMKRDAVNNEGAREGCIRWGNMDKFEEKEKKSEEEKENIEKIMENRERRL